MSDIQIKAQSKICDLLGSIHLTLSKHPSVANEARDLNPSQQELMGELQDHPFLYQNLITLLAIDSYSKQILGEGELLQDLSGMLTVLLENTKKVGESLKGNEDRKNIISNYHNAYESLLECIQLHQKIFPKSNFINDQNILIENSTSEIKAQETMLAKLRDENQELKRKLQINDQQLLNMEFKLTKLLKEQEDCERGASYNLGNGMSFIELRDEVAFKEQEIERMNEEFSYEIEKYNTVYDAMKKELEEMKGYQNIDLIEQIEMLETEVVRLREERQRDQIIIRQLRSDNMMFSGGGMSSPRYSKRFTSSRYDY